MHLVHKIHVKMEEVREQFVVYGLRILLRERKVPVFVSSSRPEGRVNKTHNDSETEQFFPFMGLAFFSVPPVIDSVTSTPSPAERQLSWNGPKSAWDSLCMEISSASSLGNCAQG